MATSQTTTRESTEFPFPTRKNPITDDYKISLEVLGDGISGKVYRCEHRTTKQRCALKILIDSEKARREVIMHKKACKDCLWIVQILDIYENVYNSKPCLFIIMECMEGGELYNRIKQRSTNPFTEREAAGFIWMIVQGVAHLHAMDMAHRDLKPENLLLTSTENDALLKLTDFGFAKEGNNELQPLHSPCYTAYYVAPEILTQKNYDKACDIWSMGVIMYILLSGCPPFYSNDNGAIMSDGMKRKIKGGEYRFDDACWRDISKEAKLTIKQMLTVDPSQRITINEILNCSWLTELTSERPIDISSLRDEENWNQIQNELVSANNVQRRPDEDSPVDILGPDASRLAKKRAAKRGDVKKEKDQSPPN